jgi:hypothetical protein
MIRSLLKLAFVLLVGILVYNYFYGTAEEKAQSKEVFGKVRDLGRDAWNLLRSEKEKLDEGKYDGAIDQVSETVDGLGDLLRRLKTSAEDLNDSGVLDQLSDLESRRQSIEQQLDAETPTSYDQTEDARIRTELKDLLQETENLMQQMEKQ